MLKTVVASKHVANQVSDSYDTENAEDFTYGLVIGHIAKAGKECQLVHLARTPVEEGDEGGGHHKDDDDDAKVTKLEEVDPEWIGEHAKQVVSMLPGGMEITGLFVASDKDVFGSKVGYPKLIKALTYVEKIAAGGVSEQLVLLHLDRRSTNVRCEVVTSKGVESKTRPVEYSEPDDDLKWMCVKANLVLDLPMAFSTTSSEKTIKQKLAIALQRLEKSLASATLLVDGLYRNDEELLDPTAVVTSPNSKSNKGGKGKKNKSFVEEAPVTTTTTDASSADELGHGGRKTKLKEFEVDILMDEVDLLEENSETDEAASKMRITGRLSTRAYMSSEATVGMAATALRKDILRTLSARFEMHCDSLVGEELRGADDAMPTVHEPPRRVNVNLPGSAVTVSDFLFPGETPDESVEAIEEMFGFAPTFEHVDDELEIVASPKTVMVIVVFDENFLHMFLIPYYYCFLDGRRTRTRDGLRNEATATKKKVGKLVQHSPLGFGGLRRNCSFLHDHDVFRKRRGRPRPRRT